MPRIAATIAAVLLMSSRAHAHASEQGFVLLLPTEIYIRAGVASVVLTILLLVILPKRVSVALFRPVPLIPLPRIKARHVTSTLSAALVILMIGAGLFGTRDPLINPLPLGIWVIWWIMMVTLQGMLINHWRWTNPWTGLAALIARMTGETAPLRFPRRLGSLPGIIGFILFAGFLLADPAPADPTRLARIVGLYWLAHLAGVLLFGPVWLLRAECITMLMRAYGRMAMLGRARGRIALGLPGWQVLRRGAVSTGTALFILLMLGSGSFDGLNETFWWLGIIDVNPLEFPGRSAVMTPTLTGLLVANAALILVFLVSVWLGLRLAGSDAGVIKGLRTFAPSILPIALGYHVAHYLTTFLVDGQYVLKIFDDTVTVTTGFLNTPATVKLIWLTQAGAVVIGHVIAILMAHAQAITLLKSTRRAVLSQAPLALFMVAYTFFGLWLLASPRGF